MEYLFEIYTEEIPAMFLNEAVKDLKILTEKKLSTFSIGYKKVETFGTPHRLVLYIKGLEKKEEDRTVEIKGPPISIALNDDGTPKEIYNKFLESNRFKDENILIKETKKGKYIFGKKVVAGRDAYNIMKEISLFLLAKMRFPKSMHWEETNVRFVRPIRHILALLDGKVVEFEFAGVKSARVTFGLRIDKQREIEIENPAEYFKKLKENYIILSYFERKQVVERKSRSEAAKVNGKPLYSMYHFEEVTNLTGYPTPFLASIDKNDFNIPKCITQSIIEGHMKSFAIVDDKKHLLPYFIGVRNGSSDFIETVKNGYERVAKARMLDGKFFFEEDKKVKLEKLTDKLSGVVFIKGLGTLKDKTERLTKLARGSESIFNLEKEFADKLQRSAFLSKTDLLTNVVREFTELQGTMGGIYAELQGEDKSVATAISEQYLPRFSGDEVPKTVMGKYLSLLDKIDTLCGAFGIGVSVSGSKDPFSLRRAGTGIMQITSSLKNTNFSLTDLIRKSIGIYQRTDAKFQNKEGKIIEFLKDRERAILKEKGIRYDVINAVISLPIDLTPTYLDRAETLMEHLSEETMQFIALSNKRVANILEKTKFELVDIDKSLFFEHEEENLFEAIVQSEGKIVKKLGQADYNGIIEIYFTLSPVISQFFDEVLVMDKDEKVRFNRLSLLAKLQKLFNEFADFSQIVFDKKA